MKLVVVLPGGGACGRWQEGVLKYFYDIGLFPKVSLICGTSVGGLNTLLMAKHIADFEKSVDLWETIRENKNVFLGMLQLRSGFWLIPDGIGMLSQIFNTNKGKSVLDPSPLYHIIDKEFGEAALRDFKVPIKITTTDLYTGKRLVFSSEKNPLYKASALAKSTSAIPLAFPAVEERVDAQDDLCVDGGLGRNNPVDVAIKSGATHILLIGTSPDEFPRKVIKNNVIDIAMRIPEIVMNTFEEECWEEKEYYEEKRKLDPTLPQIKFLDLYPKKSTGSTLNFGNVEQLLEGYSFAKSVVTEKIIEDFLK